MASKNKEVTLISTRLENDQCGIFPIRNGQVNNIECLAVAATDDDHWFAVDMNGKFYYFRRFELA